MQMQQILIAFGAAILGQQIPLSKAGKHSWKNGLFAQEELSGGEGAGREWWSIFGGWESKAWSLEYPEKWSGGANQEVLARAEVVHAEAEASQTRVRLWFEGFMT